MRRLVLLLTAALLLAACADKSPNRPAQQAAPEPAAFDVVKVAVYPWETEPLDTLIAAYQTARPNTRVEKVVVEGGADRLGRLQEKAAKGEIDLATRIGSNDASSLLQPLDPYLARSGLNLGPLGKVAEQLRKGGQLYELPYVAQPPLLVYNKAMLAEAGISVPPEGLTWEGLREAAAKLTRGEGDDRIWGLAADMYHNLARSYVEEKAGKPVWQADPALVREALEYFSTLVLTDRSMEKDRPQQWQGKGFSVTIRSGEALQALQAGRAAMAIAAYAEAQKLATEPGKWGMAPVPSFAGIKPVAVIGPLCFGIVKDSPRSDAAWDFLQFIAGPEGAAVVARAGWQPLYITDAVAEASTLPYQQWASDWTLDHVVGIPEGQKVWTFTQAVNETLSGALPLERAFSDYVMRMQR